MNTLMLLAGGSGSRINSGIAKQHIVVENNQLIEYTLKAFDSSNAIDNIVIVCNSEYLEQIEELKKKYDKISKIVPGGVTRIQSVKNGVRALEAASDDKIIISDAARPCISGSEIRGLVDSLDYYKAVTTGINCYETLLKVEGARISQIISRDGIVRQTSPEGYRYSVLKLLYIDATEEIISSYSNIGIDQLHASGIEVGIVPSSQLNFKITTPEDLIIFESIVKNDFDKIINR